MREQLRRNVEVVGVVLPEGDLLHNRSGPIKTWVLLLSTVLVTCSLAIYTTILVVVPRFADLFAGFGGELPMLTDLVLDYSKYTIVFVFVGAVPLGAMWRYRLSGSPNAGRDFRRVVTSFGISMLVLGVTVTGMYLPVLMMGAVLP